MVKHLHQIFFIGIFFTGIFEGNSQQIRQYDSTYTPAPVLRERPVLSIMKIRKDVK
ncbi:hypothetical protein [Antarcticibacterium flavum]|uniref:hypothetical protein n=1 Tax=Antarcticibacterium flavum TaxID=2058175 RepID=UPI00143D422B|nr:hypothetical protein [Antarcticibacterium flavum]